MDTVKEIAKLALAIALGMAAHEALVAPAIRRITSAAKVG